MTKKERLSKLQREASEEMAAYLSAAKLLKKIDGFSISGDDATVEKIKNILSFQPKTEEGRDLKKGILAEAIKKANKGMFGDGVFLID